MSPFISICIPAYKNVEFLKRLPDSIAVQSFKNFEVILSDDSPGKEVEQLANAHCYSVCPTCTKPNVVAVLFLAFGHTQCK